MLNGIATAVQGAVQADAAVCVAGDFLSPAVGFVNDGFQFLDRKRRLRNQFAVLADPRAVRHVDLDPVSAVIELLPRRFARLDRTIHDLRPLRHLKLGSVAFQRVTTGG